MSFLVSREATIGNKRHDTRDVITKENLLLNLHPFNITREQIYSGKLSICIMVFPSFPIRDMNGFYFISFMGELAPRISLWVKHRLKLAVFVVNKIRKPIDRVITAKPDFIITSTKENFPGRPSLSIKVIDFHELI